MNPEEQARVDIDDLLIKAGWHIYDMKDANISASKGVALREFPLKKGHGEADYLLYLNGKAVGVIEVLVKRFARFLLCLQFEKFRDVSFNTCTLILLVTINQAISN